jgi:hypothetical protein
VDAAVAAPPSGAFNFFTDARVDVGPHEFFAIRVVEKGTGTPLPGAELTTTHHVVHVSDRNGNVAFYEPGLMGKTVFFSVALAGYQLDADAFGFRGVRLTPLEGKSGTIELPRVEGAPGPGPDAELARSDDQTTLLAGPVPGPDRLFRVLFLDAASRRPVPLVELRSPLRLQVSDSGGSVAFYEPRAMEQEIRFLVRGHGYRLASNDPEGAVTLRAMPGGTALVELLRENIAERLYRITGGGIYRDSVMLGIPVPLANPVLAGDVVGQDTTQTALLGGRIIWIWGDTTRPSYPLGNFHAAGAVSDLPAEGGGLDPERGVDLRYFVDATGFARAMAPNPRPNPGVTWLFSLIALPDNAGREVLVARYDKLHSLTELYEQGVVRLNQATNVFEEVRTFNAADLVRPGGHPYLWRRASGDYVHFTDPLRVPATFEDYTTPSRYEAFTAHAATGDTIDRAPDGSIRYAWRPGVPAVSAGDVESRQVSAAEALFGHVRDVLTGKSIKEHAESIAYNSYRRRFIRLLSQQYGESSFLGELWYQEGDSPLGPWTYARKIVTHDRYTFYNPRHHPFFDKDGGRTIFFEGTYTASFSGNADETPRYDYNQIMYRLDLGDARLVLPVPVYDVASAGVPGDFVTRDGLRPGAEVPRVSFFAPDRPGPGLVPVAWTAAACAPRRLVAAADAPTQPLFFAVPASADPRPPGVVPLTSFAASDGRRAYALAGVPAPDGFVPEPTPLAYVWPNPMAIRLPVEDYLGPLVADAGDDRCVTAAGEVTIALDGSRSRHETSTITAYAWSWIEGGASRSATGPRPEIQLNSPGLHRIRLEVTGADGARAEDEVVVQVAR